MQQELQSVPFGTLRQDCSFNIRAMASSVTNHLARFRVECSEWNSIVRLPGAGWPHENGRHDAKAVGVRTLSHMWCLCRSTLPVILRRSASRVTCKPEASGGRDSRAEKSSTQGKALVRMSVSGTGACSRAVMKLKHLCLAFEMWLSALSTLFVAVASTFSADRRKRI